MFDWIYDLLGTLLSWFSSLFGGKYVFALLLYALLFKLVFLPFAIKQQKSQIAMAKFAPEMEQIQAKYRGKTDEASIQKQQQELIELQQREGFSPAIRISVETPTNRLVGPICGVFLSLY